MENKRKKRGLKKENGNINIVFNQNTYNLNITEEQG